MFGWEIPEGTRTPLIMSSFRLKKMHSGRGGTQTSGAIIYFFNIKYPLENYKLVHIYILLHVAVCIDMMCYIDYGIFIPVHVLKTW